MNLQLLYNIIEYSPLKRTCPAILTLPSIYFDKNKNELTILLLLGWNGKICTPNTFKYLVQIACHFWKKNKKFEL